MAAASARASAPARAALAGNPSDGYGGATLAVAVGNYAAEVRVARAAVPSVEPPSPLVSAAVRRFAAEHAPGAGAVEVRWSTTIPREVGLAGSSAIVTAVMRALAELHGLQLELARLPGLVLAVEQQELGIVAGLQDRVAQAYGGVTFMDFDPAYMARHGHGRYERLDLGLLPPLYLAHRPEAAEHSGRVHGDLRARFERGDERVRRGMYELAALAHEARAALLSGDSARLAACIDGSYDVRASLLELDPRHVEMVEAARALGACANYAGSGGAIVGLCRDAAHRERLRAGLAGIGCVVVTPLVA